uniref:Uncharacterized protein n=1 Tax=Lepeophtheirus salmonis TaxID=72036 RepID=A0A0K2TR49_LEPSM
MFSIKQRKSDWLFTYNLSWKQFALPVY